MRLPAVLAVLAAGAVLAVGCGGDDDEDAGQKTDATTTARTTEAGGGMDAAMGTDGMGHELYVQAGCGACHGEKGEGTEVGPSLPGHGKEVLIRQVRSPVDKMPAYSRAKLSDEDLDEIAEYVASLAPAETHVEPVRLSELAATHHWMALSASEAGELKDAIHHVDHIIDLVKGKHRAAIKEAREHLEAGDAHEAEHLIEEMLAGKAKPDLSLTQLHLRLALTAAENRESKDAKHHVRHALDTASGEMKRDARAVLASLEKGDLHEVEHGLERLLGGTPHDD